MKNKEIGYLAGIIDGEGCISIRKDSRCNSYQVSVQITNTDLRMIYFIKDLFGGSVRCRGQENKDWRVRYDYCVVGRKCEILLKTISNSLVCKKEQAKLALDFIAESKRNKTGNFGYEMQLHMKALNAFRPIPATTERVGSLTREMRQSELVEMKNHQREIRSGFSAE